MTVLNALGLEGRLGLKPYLLVAMWLATARFALLMGTFPLSHRGGAEGAQTAHLILSAFDLLMLWPFVILNVRRAHDRGSPGRFEAIVVALVTAAWIMPDAWALSVLPEWLSGVFSDTVATTLLFTALAYQLDDRKLGDNRYGPATATASAT